MFRESPKTVHGTSTPEGQGIPGDSNIQFHMLSSASVHKLGIRPSIMFTKHKPLQSALSKRFIYKLVIDGVDMTPKVLISHIYPGLTIEEKQQAAMDFTTTRLLSTSSSCTTMLGAVTSSMFMPRFSVIPSVNPLAILSQFEEESLDRTAVDDHQERRAPSAFFLPRVYPKPRLPGNPALITLRETDTSILFDRQSYTAEADTPEAQAVEQDNFYYEYITTGKGKNRKVMNAEVQTMDLVEKTRATNISRCRRRNGECFTTVWLMHDTFAELERQEALREAADGMKTARSLLDVVEDSQIALGKDDVFGVETGEKAVLTDEEQVLVICQSDAFKDAVTKMERALASNVYQTQQKFFKGLLRQDPYRLDVEYKYTLKYLWSFSCETVNGRCVTAMCWSKSNKNLLAVGYGNFYYTDRQPGLVCCWSLKNPSQPERIFNFESSVTHLDFSTDNPNLLAVSFYDGSIAVVDVVAKEKNVLMSSNKRKAHYYPVWQVLWYNPSVYLQQEAIMTAGQDGTIHRYSMSEDFRGVRLMRIAKVEGMVKGIAQARRCRADDIPITRYGSALVLTRHPAQEDIYYVATDEGCVHKCSTNYLHQHLDLFLAHLGPIYSLAFSPFCSRVFLTCGADWCVRVWAEEVFEPLVTLTTAMETVQCAVWSPTQATILASIADTDIHIWDLRRKTFVPASTTTSPSNSRNTLIQFTDDGENILVGDVDGNIHVFGLEDMPFPPYFQEEHLITSIKKALITRQDILIMLKKSGKPF